MSKKIGIMKNRDIERTEGCIQYVAVCICVSARACVYVVVKL